MIDCIYLPKIMSYSIEKMQKYINHVVGETELNISKRLHKGKVRDTYIKENHRILVATDRQSAFDRMIANIPFKGQVLNRCAAFWFKKTDHIIQNHMIALVDPNVLIVKSAQVFPIEFVVRDYLAGTTDTSILVNYTNGVRNFCGHILPDGLKKNEKLPQTIVTPTTKPELGHDESISRSEIIKQGLMTSEDFDYVEQKTLEIFKFSQEYCAKTGLILADTKYEFGKLPDGTIILVDEINTPDSSRFWEAKSYNDSILKGDYPKSFDKDVLRRWYSDRCDPYADKDLPDAPSKLIAKMSNAYQVAYEIITGEEFIPENSENINKRIDDNLTKYFYKK
jgi:phosphoribosylaminoimidazole-succinocarboxamide synthase